MTKILVVHLVFLSAVSLCTAAQETKSQESLSVSISGKTWAVEIDSPGFTVETNERKPDGRQYLLANNSKSGVVLSVTLEQANGGADSSTCPDFLKQRVASLSNLGVKDVKYSEVSSMPIAEYFLPTLQDLPIKQENVVACTAKEDVYVDIHLSKSGFKPSEESLLMDVLNRIHIADRRGGAAAPSALDGNSGDYFAQGSRYYVANNFKGAIPLYQKALDLEKQRPTLSKNYWRVLVDNLGMAYGITGDLDRSEATFNYGVSKDPEYPMFYYNLGCVYAERNDMDESMSYLSKAFERKANAIPGEGMPDPRQDDSFQRFMSNERFRKFVDSLPTSNN
jgi:Tetratricopeptide repeat